MTLLEPSKKRKRPSQARSRQRYEHMLDTAAHLFSTRGVDHVTTNHIAAAAEVSIGSLYQYFPNKEAIIEALIERYLEKIDQVFPAELDVARPIEAVIREVLGGFMVFTQKNSGFQTMLVGLEGTSNAAANEIILGRIIGGIGRVLSAYYPDLAQEQCQLCARVSFALVAGIMPHELPHDVMLDEMVLAVTAYQRAFMDRAGP